MADGIGEADLGGIKVNEFVTGFADEGLVLKQLLRQRTSDSREFIWFQKTTGYVSPVTTSGMTTNLVNTTSRGISAVAEQTFTRNTSHVKDFSVVSELITYSDERDTPIDILGILVKDLITSVSSQAEVRCYNVLTESLSPSNIQTTAAVGTGWDDATNGNPIRDILTGRRKIRQYGYIISKAQKGVLYINSIEDEHLNFFLISTKGSSIPQYSSDLMVKGAVMEILNFDVVVSENATTDYALQFIPQISAAWTQHIGLSSEIEKISGKGKKVHVWEAGEATLENPKSVHLITDTIT